MSDRPNMFIDSPDALSSVLTRLQLQAEVYVYGDFCGNWAVDTSGSRRIPFHLVGKGEAWLHMEGREPMRLSTGDLVVFPDDYPHVLASSEAPPAKEIINSDPTMGEGATTNMICGFFEFKDKSAWPLLDALEPVVVLGLSDLSSAAQTRLLIDWLIAELQREQPGYYAVLNQLAYLLFVQVVRQQVSSGRVQSGLLAALFDTRISRALAAIHNHPGEKWTLVTLADEAAMGRSSFAARFNDLTGVPPLQYLTNWRMTEATHLLKHTNLSLLDISEQCGYESEAAFRKVFKKVVGRTPGEVRRA